MDEKEKSPEPKQNIKKDKLRRGFTWLARIIGPVAVSLFLIVFRNTLNPITIYNTFWAEPSLTYNFAGYKIDEVAIYYGELINDDSKHAKEVTLKGKFDTEVIDLDVATSDSIEKKEKNRPSGSIEFSLKRLAGKSKCKFYIIVNQNSEITEQLQVSWGEKGILLLNLQKSDENIKRGIELSNKARQRWLENNTKNIRK